MILDYSYTYELESAPNYITAIIEHEVEVCYRLPETTQVYRQRFDSQTCYIVVQCSDGVRLIDAFDGDIHHIAKPALLAAFYNETH